MDRQFLIPRVRLSPLARSWIELGLLRHDGEVEGIVAKDFAGNTNDGFLMRAHQ